MHENHSPLQFTFEYFQGPLSLLIQLIQKKELAASSISLYHLISQYYDQRDKAAYDTIEEGAEFLSEASSLLLAKSHSLLPRHAEEETEISLEPSSETTPHLIEELIEYYTMKECAEKLSDREKEQHFQFSRGRASIIAQEVSHPLPLHPYNLELLKELLEKQLEKAHHRLPKLIEDEAWKISDKIEYITLLLRENQAICVRELFENAGGKIEVIVTFLGILEMLKLGSASLSFSHEQKEIFIIPFTPSIES